MNDEQTAIADAAELGRLRRDNLRLVDTVARQQAELKKLYDALAIKRARKDIDDNPPYGSEWNKRATDSGPCSKPPKPKEVKPIEEQIVDVFKTFRHRRLKHMVDHPECITNEDLMPNDLSRVSEASAVRLVVLDDMRPSYEAALEWAADAIRAQDGGDMTTETGWKSHEALEHWLTIRRALGLDSAHH